VNVLEGSCDKICKFKSNSVCTNEYVHEPKMNGTSVQVLALDILAMFAILQYALKKYSNLN
jgi:hypothetical protein